MPEFVYQILNDEGKKLKGKLVAYSKDEVLSILGERGYYVLSVKEKRGSKRKRRVKRKELLTFTVQFYSLIESSVPLLKGLQDVVEETKNPHFKKALTDIIERVRAGETLSQAFSRYPEIFPNFYISAIKTGEISGTLSEVLKDLIDVLEKNEQFEAELKQALTYPTIAVCALSGVAFFYLFYILPKVVNMTKDMGIELPAQTRILLSFVGAIKQFWIIPVALIIGLPLLFIGLRKTEKVGRAIDKFLLNIPLVGTILKKSLIARFSQFLSLLLRSGIDIVTSLEILIGLTGNRVIKDGIESAKEKLVAGTSLTDALSTLPFSSLSLSMIGVGEETGRLIEELLKIAEYNQRDVENTTKRAITYLEPAMLVTFGLFAGIIFLSVLMPIYDAVSKITAGP